jgi:hypothetical protein
VCCKPFPMIHRAFPSDVGAVGVDGDDGDDGLSAFPNLVYFTPMMNC